MTPEIADGFMALAVPQEVTKKQLEQLKKYKVLICDRCHKPQMGSGESVKCLKCNKVNRFVHENVLRGFLITTDDPLEASNHVIKLAEVCEQVRITRNGGSLSQYFNREK